MKYNILKELQTRLKDKLNDEDVFEDEISTMEDVFDMKITPKLKEKLEAREEE